MEQNIQRLYYFKHIHDSITKKAGRWILSSFEGYFPNSGITTNSSESFDATSKRVFNHQEVKIDQTVLSLYFLQNYYLKEIMRGYCNLGEWNLKLFHLRKLISNVDFPKDAISPDEVARVVRNEISEGSQVDHKDPLRSWVTGIAKYLVRNNRVLLNSSMGCFNVCGLKDTLFVVQLFPKETCSCTSSSNCCHINACKLAVGQTIVNKKYYNLSEIRQKARGRVKSGRKQPRKKDELRVNPAPDSTAMTSMPKVHDNTSCSNMSPDPSETINSLRPNTSNKTKTNLRKKTKTASSKGAKLQVNKITKTRKFANSAFSNAFSLPKLGFVNEEMPWIDASFPSISSSPEKETIAVVGGLALLKSDLNSLRNEEWLSDAIIDIFLTFCSQAPFLKDRNIEVLTFPCHFITWLLAGKCSSAGFRHWVASIKPLRYDAWLIPALVNDDHWLLNVFICKKQILAQLNSFHNGNPEVIEAILDFFGSEYFDSFGQCPKFEDWDICVPQDVPAQANAYDCGVHVCISSYSLCHGIFCMYEKDASTLIRSWIATNVINTDSATLLIPHSKASSDPTLSVTGSAPTAGKFQISRNPPTAYVSTKDFFLHWSDDLFQGNYSTCAAQGNCSQPLGNREMGFCMFCRDWYHIVCVGTTHRKAAEASVFFCTRCSNGNDAFLFKHQNALTSFNFDNKPIVSYIINGDSDQLLKEIMESRMSSKR